MATTEKKPAEKKTAAKKPAAAKKPVEREVIKASTGEKKAETKAETKAEQTVIKTDGKTGSATGKRIGAVILWLVAIGFEVLAILLLNGTLFIGDQSFLYKLFGDNAQLYSMIGAIILDMACVIIGSQLWKKANRIDPASEKNKLKFFLWNNMGLVAAVIAFVPLLVLVLKDKDLDPKAKKIVTAIAAIALVIAGLFSYDFNPVSSEDLAAAQEETAAVTGGVCYWTQWGKSYHYDQNCQSLTRSKTLYEGTIEEAFEAKRTDPCDFCVPQEGVNNLSEALDDAA